jgi:DNA-binding CsgD family transcriptional regulator
MQVALARTGLKRSPLEDLTPRQLQMVSLLAKGKAYGEIASELSLSYKTVANTCSELKHKLAAKNLPDLIRIAVQLVADAP